MSDSKPASPGQKEQLGKHPFSSVFFSLASTLMRWSVLTGVALLLLLLPALLVKPPKTPERRTARAPSNTATNSPASESELKYKSNQARPSNWAGVSAISGQTHTVNIPLDLAQLESDSEPIERRFIAQNPLTVKERAQFSFLRYQPGSQLGAPNYQVGGITVSGPILSGRGLARDVQGRLVSTLSQPNLLVAGRGFIPSSVNNTSGAGGQQVEARNAPAATPSTSENEESELRLEEFGAFRFEEERVNVFRVLRARNGVREVVGSLRVLDDQREEVTLIEPGAAATWNELVGELFLMVVSPELLGVATTDGFELQKIDVGNHLQLLRIRNGDLIQFVNGRATSEFTIESLPDLLLERRATIQVRRGDGQEVALQLKVQIGDAF